MTWSNNWISNDESIWSILMKFKVANAISNDYLKKTYTCSLENPFLFEEFFPYTLNYRLWSEQLSLDLAQYFASQIERWGLHYLDSNVFNSRISKSFNYCTRCIQSGFHSTLHQLHIFEFCPYHREERLINTCKKCKIVLSLESVFSERGFYKCSCGNCLVQESSFFNLQIKWRETALMTFDQRLFSKNQIIIYNKAVSKRGQHSQFFDVLNCVAKIKFTNCKQEIEVESDKMYTIYKAYLRRIRGQCKKKCLKSHFKLGRLAKLCGQCKCYLKIRYQFEDISSEWDLFSTVKLKKEKQNIIDSAISIQKSTIIDDMDIKETIKYNVSQYMLFYDLEISYIKLLHYVNHNLYDENHLVAFILTIIDKENVILTVHY